MPFKSLSQARKLFATNPKVAKEFAKKTSKAAWKKMPKQVKKKK